MERRQTDLPLLYRVAPDWKFFNSLDGYESTRLDRSKERAAWPPLDARAVLYGRALLEFIVTNVRQTVANKAFAGLGTQHADELPVSDSDVINDAVANEISSIHSRWLMTARDDLRRQSPREVLLARREFIDFDLQSRELQWSLQGEGPPCLARESPAYRFSGFGTHEGVLYYDLVRHLLWNAWENLQASSAGQHETGDNVIPRPSELKDIDEEISRLEKTRTDWLESPDADSFGRTPANIIENERRRLPLALTKHEAIIDDDCHTCVMMAKDPTLGPTFWHLDGCNVDDDFTFSDFLTRDEWEAENRRREEFSREFDQKWEERQQRIARGEQAADDFDLDWGDPFNPDAVEPPSDDEAQGLIQ